MWRRTSRARCPPRRNSFYASFPAAADPAAVRLSHHKGARGHHVPAPARVPERVAAADDDERREHPARGVNAGTRRLLRCPTASWPSSTAPCLALHRGQRRRDRTRVSLDFRVVPACARTTRARGHLEGQGHGFAVLQRRRVLLCGGKNWTELAQDRRGDARRFGTVSRTQTRRRWRNDSMHYKGVATCVRVDDRVRMVCTRVCVLRWTACVPTSPSLPGRNSSSGVTRRA